MRRAIRVILAGGVVLAVVIAIGIVVAIRKPIPDTTGTLTLSGLTGPVDIRRDAYGVPHITADTTADLFYAQGYVNAQDRFHEMDVRRHMANGQLSELVGIDGVGADRFMRATGWPERARFEARTMPTSAKLSADAYARGVNAYIGGRAGSSLALEYTAKTLVGSDYRPSPWHTSDSVAFAGLLDWSLADGVTDDVDRILIGRHMPSARVSQLFPGVGAKLPDRMRAEFTDPSSVTDLLRLRDAVATVSRVTGIPDPDEPGGTGTDTWISGRRLTARVAAAVSIPGPWYQVGLHCRVVRKACPYDVAGLSMTGLPGVLVGRNRSIAWGLAPRVVDRARLAVVRGRADNHGPVVAMLPNGHRIVLRWKGLDDRPGIPAILAMDRATSPAALTSAADRLDLPFATVFLSTTGQSGRVPGGPLPTRPSRRSREADLLVSRLVSLPLPTAFARQGQNTLRRWNREMSPDDPASAYFAAVWRQLLALTFHDEIPRAQWPDGGARWMTVIRALLKHPDSTWWDNLSTPQVVERRDDILRDAMVEARDELTRLQARDITGWDWGDLHGLSLQNPTLSGRLFERGPVRMGGSSDTFEATEWNPVDGYETTRAPVAGIVADLGRPTRSRWIQATGASGHPFARHYTDQLDDWIAGKTVAWPWSSVAAVKAGRDVLRLRSP